MGNRRQILYVVDGGVGEGRMELGTVEAVTSVVLTFDVALDPATAQNPEAYELIRKFRSSGDEGFGGFGGSESSSRNSHVAIESATYDAAVGNTAGS